MIETTESRVDELERKIDILFKYLDTHDRMFKAQDEKAKTIVKFCKLNKSAIDSIMKTKVLTK